MTNFTELFNQQKFITTTLARGQIILATLLVKSPQRLIFDIGSKSEGVVTGEEYREAREFIDKLQVGDKVQVTVVTTETHDGLIILSLKESIQEGAWASLKNSQENKTPTKVKILSKTSGGVNVEFLGITSFIPRSQIGRHTWESGLSDTGKFISALILEANPENKKLVLSERAISEKEETEKQEKIMEGIVIGEKFPAQVVKIVPFGIFVKITRDDVSFEGLVHLSELSYQRVNDPGYLFKEGDEVEVMVIGKKDGKLSFSIKQAQQDPWEEIEKKFLPGDKVNGVVILVQEKNVVVRLEGGIDGSLSKNKIPAGINPTVGDKLECLVEKVDTKQKKLLLSLLLKEKPIGYK